MSPSPCEFFFVLYTIFSIFGFSSQNISQNTTAFRALTSQEEYIYLGLPEVAKTRWIRRVLERKLMNKHTELERKLMIKDIELTNVRNELNAEKTNNVFSKFMCALALIGMQLDRVIAAATNYEKFLIAHIDCASKQIPDAEKSSINCTIRRILAHHTEHFRNDAYKLSEAFYWAITDSTSDASKYLRGNLTQQNYEIWECVAVVAAFRKLCNEYVHRNGSQTVNIYKAYSEAGLPQSIFEIIREYNSWTVTKRDLNIINIVLRYLMNTGTIPYHEFEINTANGETLTLALPIEDPASSRSRIACSDMT